METSLSQVQSLVSDFIPEWVMELLWFTDGPQENIKNIPGSKYDAKRSVSVSSHGVTINISHHNGTYGEPSAISLKLPVEYVTDYADVSSPGYYPSYQGFSPKQRWIYLNWLKNPLEKIDVGYVFVFYYGLERHLLPDGKYDKAFDAIRLLRKSHPKIDSYAFEALLISTILHEDRERYLQLIEGHKVSFWAPYLASKRHFGVGVTADEIIRLAGTFGFKNRRYINSDNDLFRSILEGILINKYASVSLPLDMIDMTACPKVPSCYLANYSIKPEIRQFHLPNIADSDEFKKTGFELLAQTHESVKVLLKERRQQHDNSS